MPARTVPLTGDELLVAVTEAMVALHERYHHRTPLTAKTLLLDDELLACVLGGVYTDVEKTMIELQHTAIVKQNSQHVPDRDATQVRRRDRAAFWPGSADVHLKPPCRARHRAHTVHTRRPARPGLNAV